MYARARLFSIRGLIGPAASVGACSLLAACVGNPFADAKVDADSPVAAEVAKVAHANRAYPTFASIPAAPKDVRPPRRYGELARKVEQSAADLEQKTEPGTWSLTDAEGFAARARTQAGNESAPASSGAADAFANSQRKRATPPPPPPN
jgi:hypothetical protein